MVFVKYVDYEKNWWELSNANGSIKKNYGRREENDFSNTTDVVSSR